VRTIDSFTSCGIVNSMIDAEHKTDAPPIFGASDHVDGWEPGVMLNLLNLVALFQSQLVVCVFGGWTRF
jgi:hypothetical protein